MSIVVDSSGPAPPDPAPATAVEQAVLDPGEVATGRTAVDITQVVGKDGIDWGDAQIEQYLAQAQRGQLPVDYRVPNRQIQIPLVLKGQGAVSFTTIREQIQAKAALFHDQGGWVKRVLNSGAVLYADVVGATLKLSGGWLQAHRGVDVDAVLTLEAIPDFYGDEIALDDIVETTAAEIATVLKLAAANATVKGNYPGRLRLAVDNDDGSSDQRGLIYGIRSRHYSAASTARLAYEAEALTPLDLAASAALTGASGGNAVKHANLSTMWTPVLSTTLAGVGALTHVGSYRLFARVYSTSGKAVQVRALWDVGDLVFPEENDPWTFPGGSAFYIADLGPLRLDQALAGTHRWAGQIQARGAVGGEEVQIDRLWLVPVDEAAGTISAPINADPGLASYAARDELNHTGALTGKTAPVGGVWAGAGDADDFTVGSGVATRSATSDTAPRFAVAGTGTYTTVAVQVDVKQAASADAKLGAIARYIDTSNYLTAHLINVGFAPQLRVEKVVTGGATPLGPNVPLSVPFGAFYTVRLMVTATGLWAAWVFPQGANAGEPVAFGRDSALATGGALASGKVGFRDTNLNADASARTYDNFAAWVPPGDAVMFAGRSAELRWDGACRQDPTGAAYGPLIPDGDLPRIPASGLEGRPVELFLKASRGDLDQLPDTGIDDLSVRAYYRPSWLIVPGS